MTILMAETESDPFDGEIEAVQERLRGFVISLIGSAEDVDDILQETNHVLWRKREDFEPGTSFWAWSSKVAYFQVMSYRKRRSRERHIFGDELIHRMADEQALRESNLSMPDRELLEEHLSALNARHEDVLRSHYFHEESVAEIANKMGVKCNAVSQLLFRARKSLRESLQKSKLSSK